MIESRELFEREVEATEKYLELALQAPSAEEARTLLGLAKRRLADATKMAVPEPRREAAE